MSSRSGWRKIIWKYIQAPIVIHIIPFIYEKEANKQKGPDVE